MINVNERCNEIQKLVIEAYELLEPQFDNLASKLENPIELSHFLTGLENRIAINIGLKMAELSLKKRLGNEN